MKIMKNKSVKIAALAIMLCLLTTCAIGTTFAKYVTGADAEDYARVAKWGVKIDIAGDDMFKDTYVADATALEDAMEAFYGTYLEATETGFRVM